MKDVKKEQGEDEGDTCPSRVGCAKTDQGQDREGVTTSDYNARCP